MYYYIFTDFSRCFGITKCYSSYITMIFPHIVFVFNFCLSFFCSLLIEELEDKQRLIQKKITKLEQKLEDYKREMDVIDSHMENLSSQGNNRSL